MTKDGQSSNEFNQWERGQGPSEWPRHPREEQIYAAVQVQTLARKRLQSAEAASAQLPFETLPSFPSLGQAVRPRSFLQLVCCRRFFVKLMIKAE